jgi:hypothetical protein
MVLNMKSGYAWLIPAFLVVFQLLLKIPLEARQQYQDKPRAENANWVFRGDTVIITYDLIAPFDATFEVGASLVKEADASFRVPVKSATGDIGKGIYAGPNRQIQWQWRKDLPPDFAGGTEYTIVFDVKLLTGGGLRGGNWGIFSRPNFDNSRFGIDVTYYGNDYTENSFSRVYLSPLVITASYAVFANVALQVSFTRLSGDYKLKVPVTKDITKLLLNRQRLWGNGMSSNGLGLGLCFRFWIIRIGGQFIEIISQDTDLSPKEAVLLSGDLYLTPRIYIGLAMISMNQTGLISPVHVGASIPSEDQGVSRRGFMSPTVIVFRIGADVF